MRQWLRSEPASLAFAEVWDDLTRIAAQPSGQRSWSIRRSAELDGDVMSVYGEAGSGDISRDDLLDIWQQLRSYGYLSVDGLPDAIRDSGADLIGVLQELPYVEPAVFGVPERKGSRARSTGDLLGSAPAGIRLAPNHLTEQPRMFSIRQSCSSRPYDGERAKARRRRDRNIHRCACRSSRDMRRPASLAEVVVPHI